MLNGYYTPYNVIFLSDTGLNLLETLSDGEPQIYIPAHEELLLHNLAAKYVEVSTIQEPAKSLDIPRYVKITNYGRSYLSYFHEKTYSRQLAEDSLEIAKESFKISKKAFTIDKIILILTAAGIFISVLIAKL